MDSLVQSRSDPDLIRVQEPYNSPGKQRTGSLWSSLADVYAILQIDAPPCIPMQEAIFQHIRCQPGQRLFFCGEKFTNLYLIKAGFMKNIVIDERGNEQIISFPMRGDILGFDGYHTQHHTTEAVALCDVEAILLPHKTLIEQSRSTPGLLELMCSQMSKELNKEHVMIGMLGGLSAEAKVARFLISLGARFESIGFSRRIFNLRMTRHEIGSYLGLTLETVSRTLSAFNDLGYITINMRCVEIHNEEALITLRNLTACKMQKGFVSSKRMNTSNIMKP